MVFHVASVKTVLMLVQYEYVKTIIFLASVSHIYIL